MNTGSYKRQREALLQAMRIRIFTYLAPQGME